MNFWWYELHRGFLGANQSQLLHDVDGELVRVRQDGGVPNLTVYDFGQQATRDKYLATVDRALASGISGFFLVRAPHCRLGGKSYGPVRLIESVRWCGQDKASSFAEQTENGTWTVCNHICGTVTEAVATAFNKGKNELLDAIIAKQKAAGGPTVGNGGDGPRNGGLGSHLRFAATKAGIEKLRAVMREPEDSTGPIFAQFPIDSDGYAAFLTAYEDGRAWLWWYGAQQQTKWVPEFGRKLGVPTEKAKLSSAGVYSRRFSTGTVVQFNPATGNGTFHWPAESLKSDDPAAPTVSVTTPGLSIVFNGSAAPISLKNAQGAELLGPGSLGFSLHTTAPSGRTASQVRFDTITPTGPHAFEFGVTQTGERIGVVFGGTRHYLTVNFTSALGFERDDGKSVYFTLIGSAPSTLRGIGLNYMVNDRTGEGHAPSAEPVLYYEAPWANSSWNPRGRFAIYERVDDATEDETLYDLWVDEGLPRPRVSGSWDRAAAKAWVQAWIKANYDMSNMAMVPRNLSEWRAFFPYAKLMDAKVLWFNFRVRPHDPSLAFGLHSCRVAAM